MLGASDARLGIARKSANSARMARLDGVAARAARAMNRKRMVRRFITPHHTSCQCLLEVFTADRSSKDGGGALGNQRSRPCRLVAPVVPLGVVVTKSLHTFTDHASDQGPFEWLTMIDGRPGHR